MRGFAQVGEKNYNTTSRTIEMLPTQLLLEDANLKFWLEMESYIVKCKLEVESWKRLTEVTSSSSLLLLSGGVKISSTSHSDFLWKTGYGTSGEDVNLCMYGVRVGNYFPSAQAWRCKLV